ncbi:MAG TPA: hypothetical protein DCM64_04920 [Gammaproteobacteria bacterium]|jgi:ActR/RegA family two-component response regulator|nr:response regulator [Gammaproteobacteria bacterium]MDP6732773.1 response regulator [Gammaproteobacteria bacterium]HAJ75776.1 hypothetical protein [Gammaproteobacteria bacterium]|tara:strand:+ start:6164 stop:6646 length:483 start_codon:yes stop_codon:yes gene_type:complete
MTSIPNLDVDSQESNPNRLLLIDDSKEITDILEEIGNIAGYYVRSENQYELIIQEIESHDPSVIFLDLHLGPSDNFASEEIPREGLEILKSLSINKSQAKIIIISGQSRRTRELNQFLGRDLNLSVVGSMPKPFNAAKVEEALLKLKKESDQSLDEPFTI